MMKRKELAKELRKLEMKEIRLLSYNEHTETLYLFTEYESGYIDGTLTRLKRVVKFNYDTVGLKYSEFDKMNTIIAADEYEVGEEKGVVIKTDNFELSIIMNDEDDVLVESEDIMIYY